MCTITRFAIVNGHYGCDIPFSSGANWKPLSITPGQSRDWYYALGDVNIAATGLVSVSDSPGHAASAIYRSHLYDRYNWDKGKRVGVIPDERMGGLHTAGLAREYDVVGSSETHRVTCSDSDPCRVDPGGYSTEDRGR